MLTRLALICFLAASPAIAESVANPLAAEIFGRAEAPAPGVSEPHGGYSKGCLAGGQQLAETGPSWQAMRLSRNRNWGHPETIAFIERLGRKVQKIGWPRLYVGDIGQPRGGPLRASNHRSHQNGLDIDIWLAKPTARALSREEREKIGSPSVVAANRIEVNGNWTSRHHRMLKAAARDPAVARIFVNAAVKQAMCLAEEPEARTWLRKVRPWWGHENHFHVRLSCPSDAGGCVRQAPPPPGDGCDDTLAWWFSDEVLKRPAPPPKVKPNLRLADLPTACRRVAAE